MQHYLRPQGMSTTPFTDEKVFNYVVSSLMTHRFNEKMDKIQYILKYLHSAEAKKYECEDDRKLLVKKYTKMFRGFLTVKERLPSSAPLTHPPSLSVGVRCPQQQ
jgi:hypothetical protein